ncbi:MAG: LPS assembly lipoprotein LptE [Planctomycetes bacterium]|nr:LPS assembly lipoprotein LptE [Planctomycetota bacterium]
MRRRSDRPRLGLLLLALALPGCYHLGVEPVDGATSVAVLVFQNRTLRREVEHALTRHVRREVLETTPLHLAAEGAADLVVRGAVQDVREQVLIAGPAQEVVHAAVSVSVRFAVFGRDGQMLVGDDVDGDGRPDGELTRQGYAEFTAARGQTRETAMEEALRDVAEMIVHELTARRDDRHEPNDDPSEAVTITPGRQVALRQWNPDWFRVVVPPGLGLSVTLMAPEGPFQLTLRSTSAAPLPDAVMATDARAGRVPPGPAERVVLVGVTGDDRGRPYQLLVRLTPIE